MIFTDLSTYSESCRWWLSVYWECYQNATRVDSDGFMHKKCTNTTRSSWSVFASATAMHGILVLCCNLTASHYIKHTIWQNLTPHFQLKINAFHTSSVGCFCLVPHLSLSHSFCLFKMCVALHGCGGRVTKHRLNFMQVFRKLSGHKLWMFFKQLLYPLWYELSDANSRTVCRANYVW